MDTNLPGPGDREPEYLGAGDPAGDTATGPAAAPGEPAPSRRRRTAVLAASGLAVVAVVGVGGWGLAQFLSAGSSAASALPAGTAAYLTVDLDPSGTQKIEALRTLRKFPGIKKHLDLGVRDDIRRYVVDKMAADCKGLDYDKDVKPWIGEKLALAAVPLDGTAAPVLALEDSDEAAGRAMVKKLNACDDGSDAGVAYANGFLLVSDTQKHADAVAAQTGKGTLADDPDFQTWMDRAGDSGVITGYAARTAPRLLEHLAESDSSMMAPLPGMPGPGGQKQMLDKVFSAYKSFEGAAMVVRFGDGSFETEMVTKGLGQTPASSPKAPSVADLPASTAVAMSAALPEGWLRNYLKGMSQLVGNGASVDQMLREGEAQTGLKLPEDIETLLGKGVTVAVDGNIDMEGLARSSDPTQVPAVIRLSGDPAKITPIIDKLKRRAGPQGDIVKVKTVGDAVLVGLDPAYLDRVGAQGGLGSTNAFQDAVPHAADSAMVLYVSFDAGDWAAKLGDMVSHDDPEVRANVAPLQALGVSSWLDGDKVTHVQMRLTTN
jgi:hypothetical protein